MSYPDVQHRFFSLADILGPDDCYDLGVPNSCDIDAFRYILAAGVETNARCGGDGTLARLYLLAAFRELSGRNRGEAIGQLLGLVNYLKDNDNPAGDERS